MLLKGLPRAQLLLPAWKVRSLVLVRQWASKSLGSTLNEPSLFEELFPEEFQKEQQSPTVIAGFKGPVRRVTTPNKLQKHITPGNGSLAQLPSQEQNAEDQFRKVQDASVLVLSNASKSLALSDFLRLSPKGEHIDGWASGIIKVIPGRDPVTLEAQGHYFILFSTSAAASAYKEKLTRLHRIAQTHTPTSIASPLAPPPGYIKDGEDLNALMQAFTLIPSSQHHISVRTLKKPYWPGVRRMIAAGGYPAVVARQSSTSSEDLVLLSFDKGHVGVYDLRAAIGRDGKERNLQWALLAGKEDIVKLDGGKGVAEEGEVALELQSPEDLEEKRMKRSQPSRFILSFRDNQEARRFVRAWHRRPFPLSTAPPNPGDEAPPIVNAELLW